MKTKIWLTLGAHEYVSFSSKNVFIFCDSTSKFLINWFVTKKNACLKFLKILKKLINEKSIKSNEHHQLNKQNVKIQIPLNLKIFLKFVHNY